ncbi:MAG: hypothetical protein CMP23_11150, partial [Rickettsiales bacterium]|nr:hypothetical protein [Rickettsiales bacterium]
MTEKLPKHRPQIAVVGVSALFPGSQNSSGFWNDILAGRDLITEVPDTHWLPEDYYDADPTAPDKTYARRGGFLSDINFDALSWGVPPSIIEATDTSQLLALIVAESVLRDAAGKQFESMDRSRMSVILGVTSAQELLGTMVSRLQRPIWQKSLREAGINEEKVQEICQRIADHYVPWQESSFPGLLGNVVAGRIANRLDLGGTNCVTDAACASTFSALSMAVRELYLGDSDLVITGGVDTLNDIFMFMCFSKTPALSASGDCRPFSDQADGTMLGEGLGMVALKRLEDAKRDGDRIYAVLTGVGSSSDGRSKSVYAPVPAGQAKALARAYKLAGYGPETVELIEAHGTGTRAGDAAEFAGLSLVFDPTTVNRTQWCALGSVKSQIGHTKAAAGAAGLFKAVMALHHKVLPPTIKVDRPNPNIDLQNSAFHINTQARPWIRPSDHPRRASVSSFGFGGSNFHVALEEWPHTKQQAPRLRALPSELIALSADSGEMLAQEARQLAQRAASGDLLQRIAWESAHSYQASAPARLALIAHTSEELNKRLNGLADAIDKQPEQGFERPDGSTYAVAGEPAQVAFMFPGQGSQYLHMGSALAIHFDAARSAWDKAADLSLDANQRLDQVVFPIDRFDDEAKAVDEERLRATQWAQPAIGASSLALLNLLAELGVAATAVAGHSFGEVTALHAAGVLSEADLLKVARKRGELMAQASELPGAMSAISCSIEAVQKALDELDRNDVVVANHNAPNQVVISGSQEGVELAEQMLSSAGHRSRRLPVSTAFHSPIVAASSEPFAGFLKALPFQQAQLPCWSGESAAIYEAEAAPSKARLARQISRPVRFVDLVQGMADSGINTFIEVGPGAVLTGLISNCLKEQPHRAIALDRRGRDGIESFFRGLAQLVAAGTPLQLPALWTGYSEPVDPSTKSQPKLAIAISGSNYGKLYPPAGGAAELPPPNQAEQQQRRTDFPADKQAKDLATAAPSSPLVTTGTQLASLPQSSPPPTRPKAGPHSPTSVPTEIPMTAPSNSTQLPAGWLEAWQEAQRQNAASHAAFQTAMAESHSAYLRSMETSIATLAGLSGLSPSAVPAPTTKQNVLSTAQIAISTPAMDKADELPATAMGTAPSSDYLGLSPSNPAPHLASAAGTAAAATTSAPQPPAPAAPAVDLQALMLAVVADKTGYPAEMLELDMDL